MTRELEQGSQIVSLQHRSELNKMEFKRDDYQLSKSYTYSLKIHPWAMNLSGSPKRGGGCIYFESFAISFEIMPTSHQLPIYVCMLLWLVPPLAQYCFFFLFFLLNHNCMYCGINR